jgi:hypothetical protein
VAAVTHFANINAWRYIPIPPTLLSAWKSCSNEL